VRDGICSKCGGREVYASRNGLALGGGFPASVKAHIDPGFRGMRAQQATDGLWQYACANCGYCEIYLLDDAVVDFVRQAWVRVPVADTADAG
jgi:predicted nucleic-acid-binding Zn-ribbon protein